MWALLLSSSVAALQLKSVIFTVFEVCMNSGNKAGLVNTCLPETFRAQLQVPRSFVDAEQIAASMTLLLTLTLTHLCFRADFSICGYLSGMKQLL